MDADAGGLLDHPIADLEQFLPVARERGLGEKQPARHGVAQGEHQPVGGGATQSRDKAPKPELPTRRNARDFDLGL
ncbi:MAG: hypothetical protein OXC14_17270 [Rhodospirillaceae bacterium]|nr:hypothetical protein [Rhodospirillaceae bacterium]